MRPTPAGKIILEWDYAGKLHVSAPLNEKPLCMIMLAEAIKAITQAQAGGLVIPNGLGPANLEHR